ncbi:MAG TPA: signal peptidase I [Candidatus Paceibacterota bacterium]|nr:signal peptidase I [Candidatus Paceibacterota bacterium]
MEKDLNKRNLIRYLLFFCLTVLVIFFSVYYFLLLRAEKETEITDNSQNLTITTSTTQSCQVKIEEKIVKGNSMEPFFKEGETIKILGDYYHCHPVLREEVIAYDYKGSKNPIIKRVKGIAGDTFHLKQENNGWIILINNQPVKNLLGEVYLLDEKDYQMLSLYERDYKGKIPEDAYLVLGDNINNSLDSRNFGLIAKQDIIGKVEK